MAKKRQNRIVSLVLCAAVVLATVLTPNVSYAAEEADLISQGLVTYENHTDVANYRGETKTAPDAPAGKVFAGWYKEEGGEYKALNATAADAAETAYAKFVDANVFDAKFQLTADTTNVSAKTNIRLITTVDTVNYATVGFNVTFGSKTLYCGSEKVYAQINAFVDETANPIQPTVFSNASTYFVAHSIKNVTNNAFNNDFTIVPTWTTIDGTVVEATGDATMTFHVNEYAEVYPYDLEEGVTFEDERDLYYAQYAGTGYHATSVSREEYDGSYKLAIRPVNFDSDGGGYPHMRLNLGKTYPVGTEITFWFRLNANASQTLRVTGYIGGEALSGAVNMDTWAQANFTYAPPNYSLKKITLLEECDAIDIWCTMREGDVAYYDNFKIVVPIDLENDGLNFETASSLAYVKEYTASGQYHTASISREEYDGSTRLAIRPVKFDSDGGGYPHLHLSLGDTYPVGTEITFWFRLNASASRTMVVTGYQNGAAVTGAVQTDTWAEKNFTYAPPNYPLKKITLLKECDAIDIYFTMRQGDVAYYDDFKLVVPQPSVLETTGLTFESDSDLEYVIADDGSFGSKHNATISREIYGNSTRLAVKTPIDGGSYPTIYFDLKKTYPAGTTITFWTRYETSGTQQGTFAIAGYNKGSSLTGAVTMNDTWLEKNFTYDAKTITLNQPCDKIAIYSTVWSVDSTIYYDNIKVTPPAAE